MEQKPVELTDRQNLEITALLGLVLSFALQIPVAGILMYILARIFIFPKVKRVVPVVEETPSEEVEEIKQTEKENENGK